MSQFMYSEASLYRRSQYRRFFFGDTGCQNTDVPVSGTPAGRAIPPLHSSCTGRRYIEAATVCPSGRGHSLTAALHSRHAHTRVQVTPLRDACGPDFLLYGGDDFGGCDFVLGGGDGVISVTANVAPKAMAEVCHTLSRAVQLVLPHPHCLSVGQRRGREQKRGVECKPAGWCTVALDGGSGIFLIVGLMHSRTGYVVFIAV
jgi:Dihydrodipicolinate synthetase family